MLILSGFLTGYGVTIEIQCPGKFKSTLNDVIKGGPVLFNLVLEYADVSCSQKTII